MAKHMMFVMIRDYIKNNGQVDVRTTFISLSET